MSIWFRIQSGEHAGRLHLSGWLESAIGDVGIAICPVCAALVMSEEAYGDRQWAHEQWHARTDYPIPVDLP